MLSNKLLLAAARHRTPKSWQGQVTADMYRYTGDQFQSIEYLYSSEKQQFVEPGYGSLDPLLETVKAAMQIAMIKITVDTHTMLLENCRLWFDNVPSNLRDGIRFEKLSKIIIHSTTGGEPFTISDVQSCWDNINMCYDLFSEDLANWGYTNLTAGSTLDFPLELEWYE